MIIDELKRKYLGKTVHVVILDPWHPIDAVGIVESVDDAGQLHGTWGGLAAIPTHDSIQIMDVGVNNVGISFPSVHDDYGTISGTCIIYSGKNNEYTDERNFSYHPDKRMVAISHLFENDPFTEMDYEGAEELLLENLETNLDLSKIPTLDNWLKNNK